MMTFNLALLSVTTALPGRHPPCPAVHEFWFRLYCFLGEI